MQQTMPVLLVFIFLFFSPLFGLQKENDYVDPTDLFHFDPGSVSMKTQRKHDLVSVDVNTCPKTNDGLCTEPSIVPISEFKEGDSTVQNVKPTENIDKTAHECSKMDNLLLRQYVNKLIHMLEPKIGSSRNSVEINLRLKVSYYDLLKLRNFGEGNSHEIHDVHETLNYMMQFASDVLQPETYNDWLERRTGLSSMALLQIFAIILSLILLLIVLSRMMLSQRMFWNALFLAFLISVIFTWIELYQKEVADQEKILSTQKMGDNCPKVNELTFWGKVNTFISLSVTFQNEQCRVYFQAMMMNPVFKISPFEAVAVAIVKTIFTPLGIIGNGIKAFFVGLLIDLPWQYQLMVLVTVVLLVILSLFFCFGYHLRIFGLITLGPSENPRILQQITNQHHRETRIQYQQGGQEIILPDKQRQILAPPEQTFSSDLSFEERIPGMNNSSNTTQADISKLNSSKQNDNLETSTADSNLTQQIVKENVLKGFQQHEEENIQMIKDADLDGQNLNAIAHEDITMRTC